MHGGGARGAATPSTKPPAEGRWGGDPTGPSPAASTRAARRPATTSTDPNTDRPRGGRRPGHGPERRSTARRPKDGSLVTVTCRSWVAWQKWSPGWRPQSRAARHPLDSLMWKHLTTTSMPRTTASSRIEVDKRCQTKHCVFHERTNDVKPMSAPRNDTRCQATLREK